MPLDPARRVFGSSSSFPLGGQLRRPADQVLDRLATKDGKDVVHLHVRDSDLCVVEASVFRPESASGEAVPVSPFTFSTPEEAREFVEEASIALEYLGCDVSVTRARDGSD
jgi:hypothetical protein